MVDPQATTRENCIHWFYYQQQVRSIFQNRNQHEIVELYQLKAIF
jgi:hypothetical protein